MENSILRPALESHMRSSLGFHTLTLSMPLLFGNGHELIECFKEVSNKAGELQIYPDDYGNVIIKFYKRDIGVEWLVRFNVWDERIRLQYDAVEVKINPKTLCGIYDYITAATIRDFYRAIENFDNISESISPLLGSFRDYRLKRIDYCVNFSVNELAPECTSEQIIDLIKRSDIPSAFTEYTEYDEISHRKKPKSDSFYLMCQSVHINCYRKVAELQQRAEIGNRRMTSCVSQATINEAQDIIRFEVQCKYLKVYSLSKEAKKAGYTAATEFEYLLGDRMCRNIIEYYFKKTIGYGDWYSLKDAIAKIQSHNFNRQKGNRLIEALNCVNQCRSLAKAKALYQGNDLLAFNRTLNDLSDLNINPVTIPRDWGIKQIPNLLCEYYRQKRLEQSMYCLELLEKEDPNYFRKMIREQCRSEG